MLDPVVSPVVVFCWRDPQPASVTPPSSSARTIERVMMKPPWPGVAPRGPRALGEPPPTLDATGARTPAARPEPSPGRAWRFKPRDRSACKKRFSAGTVEGARPAAPEEVESRNPLGAKGDGCRHAV